MTKEMLINTVEGQECRIATVQDGRLEELYMERVSSASHVGNIYKGRITNVEPSIQAAFVDFGLPKNGFLHISDINPSYFPKNRRATGEAVGHKKGHRDRPPIQECLRRGQEVVVQLTKEGIGTKGPTMTTYLSIPGRLLVMMPGMSRLGVSRKIEDDQARDKARAILADLKPPEDIGFIVRTAAIERPKREFQRDLNYLLRLWKSVKQRIQQSKAPAEIYQESDLVTRTIRDVYNTDIDRIICDNKEVAVKAKEFLDVAMPRTRNIIELYVGKEGLFHEYGLEHEIEKIYSRRLELASGGSLVFDQAEALVAIDVNSGRFREHSDAETTATKINVEAAREIARQLRLRDLGGVVIIDFIDMREDRNHRAVEKALRDEIRNDRAKTKLCKISPFGIVEMTRQRVRPSLKQSIFRTCEHCEGTGLIKNEESQALLVMRNLQRACSNEQVAQIEVAVTPSVEYHLANFERKRINELEVQFGKRIVVKADPLLAGSDMRINCANIRGSGVAWEPGAKPGAPGIKNPPTMNLDEIVPPSSIPFPDDEIPEEPFEEEQSQEQPSLHVEAKPAVSPTPQKAAMTAPPQQPAAAPTVPAAQVPAGRPTAPPRQAGVIAPAPGAPGAPGAGKRHRSRRGGRKHRARRERQALAAQQGLASQQAPPTGSATPDLAVGTKAPAGPGPVGERVPSYERVARQEPSEEDEMSEAREMAIEQAREEAATETAPKPASTPKQQAPARAAAVPAEMPAIPAEATGADLPSPDEKVKRRRHRGGRRHKKAGQDQPSVHPEQEPTGAHSVQTKRPARPMEPVQTSPAVPPKAQPSEAPSPVPAPAPEPAAAPGRQAAQPGARKPRVRVKKGSHRQDKEYYEENLRRQKEAKRKPKDAIPDEDDEDFSTE